MLTYKQILQRSDQFVKAYPKTLAGRLRWWCQALGLSRVLFLQLLCMSPDQAVQNKDRSWKEIFQNTEWKNRAIAVEDRLTSLLTLYHYDWKVLTEWLHQPLDGGSHATQPLGSPPEVEPLAFATLQAYLSQTR